MARRMSKAESEGLGWLFIIGAPLFGIIAIGEAVGWVWIGFGIVVIIAGYFGSVPQK
jgi:hypothetical protein